MKTRFTLKATITITAVSMLCFGSVVAANESPVAWWTLDGSKGRTSADSASGIDDEILGNFKYVRGASGDALRFDGYSTAVRREAKNAPELGESFSFEAWVAFQAYPWASCAIVGQCEWEDVPFARKTSDDFTPEPDPNAGYYFAVDERGRVHLQVSVDGEWIKCQSETRIPLLEWAHIAGTYDAKKGLTVYINGNREGSTPAKGEITFASELDVLVGRNHSKRRQANPVGSFVPSLYSFDGYLDEVKIYDHALDAREIAKAYDTTKPSGETGMAFRKLPTEPRGPASFGAYYTSLKFDETWDALRREGPHSDVVVLFDDMPWRFIFWRGSSYVPFWVTENDIWYTNEFNETWPPVDEPNVFEPMSDKQALTSHVRIIENTDARVVIHWRYALVNSLYQIAWEDSLTGWGDWADEYDFIYPDGICIRKQTVWSSRLEEAHEFQESIVLNQPGTRPEDNLELGAVTVVNMDGESYTYSWADGPPEATRADQMKRIASLSYPNIQRVNTRSKAKPFLVVPDEPLDAVWPLDVALEGPVHFPYWRLILEEASKFTWWNHWPVAQVPSDGRYALDPDRTSHTSVSNWIWQAYETTENTKVKIAMQGLTEKAAEDLVPLAKSWLRAPKISLHGPGYTSGGYIQAERVYLFECEKTGEPKPLQFMIEASAEHPVINPAFIVEGWGDAGATLKIGGKTIDRGKTFRFGHRGNPNGKDLIVWVKMESNHPVEVSLLPS